MFDLLALQLHNLEGMLVREIDRALTRVSVEFNVSDPDAGGSTPTLGTGRDRDPQAPEPVARRKARRDDVHSAAE
ncbi:MAG: hypothetical protein IPQ07_22890 [Myxococcales bacterium]|nr:hypothetical protein [Myxococcales bacterium]